jgi:uracil-DNA glycosylase
MALLQLEPSWKAHIGCFFEQPEMLRLKQFLVSEKERGATVYPRGSDIFRAFNMTPYEQVKVVILGQDPYHGENQAHGLAFSVPEGIPKPPSLLNIFKALQNDLGIPVARSGDLSHWASQGVLLLNTVLTVRAGQAHSHQDRGWEFLTDRVIECLSQGLSALVFVLWGTAAQRKIPLIAAGQHLVLTAPHPSPLSAHRGFLACGHFSKINAHLIAHQRAPIDWRLPGSV